MPNTNENEVKGTKQKIQKARLSEDQHIKVSKSCTTTEPHTEVKGSCSLACPAL